MGKLPCLVLITVLLMRSRKRCAIFSTTSFSRVPLGPMAPGSSPPWPGSKATMMKRSPSGFWFTDVAVVMGAEAADVGVTSSEGALGLAIKSPTGSACVPSLEAGGGVGVAVIDGAL